ncbi:ABC transporter substrate-binding protein [Metabacillus litoralis]|uniref:ABC transporter substrate-binding protein n=1 Tax=Metabacillus litoralis TaxID=152268 RepID=A0A5C6VNF2_9BACI|nr:ABC transporter substrate-binding protein [Metabacillus litoralis]TXC86076.1 ABC transporter substrate-binding protein [Metabacillus litoralis]
MMFTIGCGTDSVQQEKDSSTTTENTEDASTTEVDAPFPVTVTDGTGEEVTIESEPKTIVSVIPSNTEITYAIGQGEKLVAVDEYSNYPEETAELEKIGGQQLNVEKILALQPDLALVTEYQHDNNRDVLTQFKEAGTDVIVINSAESFDQVYQSIALIGKVTGASEEAEQVVTEMKESLEEIREKAKAVTEKKKVWVEVSPSPDIFTTGKNTFMHEMLESINAINTAGDQTGWVKMTEEEIVTLNPDVIITTYGYYVENPTEGVLSRAGWDEVPAIKQEQVFDVNNDTVTRPGPRLIDGVETLAKLIYPDVFEK